MNKRWNELRCLCAQSVKNNLLCFALLIFNSASAAQATWVSVRNCLKHDDAFLTCLQVWMNVCVQLQRVIHDLKVQHVRNYSQTTTACCALPHLTVSLVIIETLEFGLVATVFYKPLFCCWNFDHLLRILQNKACFHWNYPELEKKSSPSFSDML